MDFPVFPIGAGGISDANNPHCSPCVECAIASEDGALYLGGLLGMLDSGAYPTAVDADVWHRSGIASTGEDTLHSAVSVETIKTGGAVLLLWSSQSTFPVKTLFSIVPMRRRGHPYDLIIGRQVLTLFDFGFSQRDGWFLRRPDTARPLIAPTAR